MDDADMENVARMGDQKRYSAWGRTPCRKRTVWKNITWSCGINARNNVNEIRCMVWIGFFWYGTWSGGNILCVWQWNLQWNVDSLYCDQTMYLRVLCGSENKQRLIPYTALTDWFL